MRVLVESYGDVRIFSERPYGYKRYIVEWPTHTQLYSGLWYSEDKVRKLVEKKIQENPI
tara:strand:+ start:656 stop:832 length:177 start_codon:yes stop_codon:yes gene_type:complete